MLVVSECVDCGRPVTDYLDAGEVARCRYCDRRLPWDGIWTRDLLRALTSAKSEFNVKIHGGKGRIYTVRRETVRCEMTWGRERDQFTLSANDGLTAMDYNAIEWLNDTYAVPVNDDGTAWKPRRLLIDEHDEDAECRVCGCTQRDCTECVTKTGRPCRLGRGNAVQCVRGPGYRPRSQDGSTVAEGDRRAGWGQ